MDEFTSEEREYIDRMLEEGKEWQRIHGNKTYTHEEVMAESMSFLKGMEMQYN